MTSCFSFTCNHSANRQITEFDLIKDSSLVLRKTKNQSNIWGFNLQINGSFVDTIKLIMTNQENVVYSQKLIGITDSIYRGDWYSDSILIKFENVKNPIKNIKMQYVFFD